MKGFFVALRPKWQAHIHQSVALNRTCTQICIQSFGGIIAGHPLIIISETQNGYKGILATPPLTNTPPHSRPSVHTHPDTHAHPALALLEWHLMAAHKTWENFVQTFHKHTAAYVLVCECVLGPVYVWVCMGVWVWVCVCECVGNVIGGNWNAHDNPFHQQFSCLWNISAPESYRIRAGLWKEVLLEFLANYF